MNYLADAFSLGMLDCIGTPGAALAIDVIPLTHPMAVQWVREHQPRSCVGHADTALLLSSMLGVVVDMRRESTSLQPGDRMLVAQYNGPRLPEGAKSLPAGAKIRWMLVQIPSAD